MYGLYIVFLLDRAQLYYRPRTDWEIDEYSSDFSLPAPSLVKDAQALSGAFQFQKSMPLQTLGYSFFLSKNTYYISTRSQTVLHWCLICILNVREKNDSPHLISEEEKTCISEEIWLRT